MSVYALLADRTTVEVRPAMPADCYKEEGTTTTPFDMVMLNDLDRFHLVIDVIDRVPGLSSSAGRARQLMEDKRITCRAHTRLEGEDAPEIRDWKWTPLRQCRPGSAAALVQRRTGVGPPT